MSDAGSQPPDVETALRWVRSAAYKPDNKLSEDIVKFDMDLLGMPATNIRGTLPPNRRPLL